MIIHLASDAPLAQRALAECVLVLHIGGGMAGIGAGAAAMAARKGSPAHRLAGSVFVPAMLVAYLVGAAAAPFIHQPANSFGGGFAAYLVATAWLAVKRPPGVSGVLEIGGFLAAATAALALALFAAYGFGNPHGIDGVPWQAAAIFAVVAALAAGLDLKVILAGGLSGRARTARHLWRMGLAFSFGTASLFIGQPKVFPPSLRGSPPLVTLGLAPLLLTLWWLARVRAPARARRLPPSAVPIEG